jgi:F-type H+-transporting ATPase subunit b
MTHLLLDIHTWEYVGLFLMIGLLIWFGAPKMIGGMLDQRAAAIAAELDEAKRLSAEAAALLVEYKKKAATAETEAAAIVREAKAEAERFAAESRAALSAQIERRAKTAQEKIAQAEASAIAEIRALAADAAVDGAQKLIAARMDAAKASTLIKSGIADLGDKLN